MVSYQKTWATVGKDSRLNESKIDMLFDNHLHILLIFHVHLDMLVSNMLIFAFVFDFQSCFDLDPIPPCQMVVTKIRLDKSFNVLKRELAFFADISDFISCNASL
ncbi:UNVERIFIED_CONTAM: hypothetical protein Sradi_3802500, partial [Sesamum radiatum]